MEFAQVDTTTMAAAAGATDFSVWALFWKADIIVKTVMIILVVASIWCWAIIIEKSRRLKRLNSDAAEFEESFFLFFSLYLFLLSSSTRCWKSRAPPGSGIRFPWVWAV